MTEHTRKEALRYMGVRGQAPAEILAVLEACWEELERTAAPKSVQKKIPVAFPAPDTVETAGMVIPEKSLAGHLNGCEEAVLFAATLGAPVDLLLQRAMRLDMSKAVILQACAAAKIEEYCDACQTEIAREAAMLGLYLRPRYSPGYGDFPILFQKELTSILDTPRKIGLTVTESCILAPSKSVTAIIGLTREAQSCHIARCMECTAVNCPFRD